MVEQGILWGSNLEFFAFANSDESLTSEARLSECESVFDVDERSNMYNPHAGPTHLYYGVFDTEATRHMNQQLEHTISH